MAPKYGGRNRREKVDRISSLPDEVLSLILSLLPTKCAVGTSILSNRWKYLWTSITSLHFDASPKHSKLVDFYNFVDKVFRNCNSSHIQKFRLHFPSFRDDGSDHVITWINEAIKRNVSELDINVYVLPSSIFSCKTLTVLKVTTRYEHKINIPSFHLPCLKVLHIEWNFPPKDFMEKLIVSCPVLEDLTLVRYLEYGTGDYSMVTLPTLRTLRIQPDRQDIRFRIPSTRTFFIKAPNLAYLDLKEGFTTCNILGDFPSLIKANVNIGACYVGRRYPGFQLLKGISAVKSLSVSSTTRIRYGFTLPKFHNLTCLKVITFGHLFWTILPKLMNSSPSLEVLFLEEPAHYNFAVPDKNTWVEPKSVPKCLRYRLAAIKIDGLKGRKHELELLEYCLSNAKVLQRLTIDCRGLTLVEEMQFCAQLLKFSRASGNCQIHFHGDFVSNL